MSWEEAATWGPARENVKEEKKKLTFLLGNVDTREAVDVSTEGMWEISVPSSRSYCKTVPPNKVFKRAF